MHHLFLHLAALEKRIGRPVLSFVAVASVAALAFPFTATAQGKDDLWEVTMKMDLPGMPMALPPTTNRVCTAKNRKEEDLVPREENCKMTESSRAGGKFNYKMNCAGANPMTIVGELTFTGDKYEGRNKMTGMMEGKPMEMTQNYSGKRVGDCTATK